MDLDERSVLFHGEPVRIKLEANCLGYGPCPEPEDIVEQHLTVNAAGRVWFHEYQFGHVPGRYEMRSKQIGSIDSCAAKELINTVAEYFRHDYENIFATDIGQWTLQIVNSEKEIFTVSGSLCAELRVDGVDLSDLLRKTVGIETLFAFDGGYEEE